MSAHLAPIDTKLTIGSLGNESHTLAKVKVRIRLAVTSLDFDQRDIYVLSAQGTLVAENGTVYVQTRGALGNSHDDAL